MKLKSKFASHHLARDQDDRRAIAVRLIQPVDEMQAARSTAAGHRGQAIHQKRFALRCKGTRLLMAHVNELDITATQTGGNVFSVSPTMP